MKGRSETPHSAMRPGVDGEATTGWETEPPRTLGNRRLRPPQRIIVQQESERTYQRQVQAGKQTSELNHRSGGVSRR